MTFAALLLLAIPSQPLSANLSVWDPIEARLQADEQANILVLGDSLSYKGWSFPFRDQLHSLYGSSGVGYQGLSRQTDAGFEPGWTEGLINFDTDPHSSLDGLWGESTMGAPPGAGVSKSAILKPWGDGNLDLHYVQQPGGGRFEVWRNPDDGSGWAKVDTLDTDGPQQVLAWRGDSPGRLLFRPLDVGKPVKILGAVNLGPDGGVRLDRAANGGWATNNFLSRDWTFDDQVSLLDSHLAVIALGANEVGTYEEFGQRLEAVADRLLAANPDVKIVLMPAYQFVTDMRIDIMQEQAHDLALKRGFGYINLYNSAGTPHFFRANEFLRDSIHWNDAGGRYIADLVTQALLTDGASLGTYSGDITGDGEVDLNDFAVLKSGFGLPSASMQQGDLTRDGLVDLGDFGVLKSTFGQSAAVPEPNARFLFAAGILVFIAMGIRLGGGVSRRR
jgi:hypothetical protein